MNEIKRVLSDIFLFKNLQNDQMEPCIALVQEIMMILHALITVLDIAYIPYILPIVYKHLRTNFPDLEGTRDTQLREMRVCCWSSGREARGAGLWLLERCEQEVKHTQLIYCECNY